MLAARQALFAAGGIPPETNARALDALLQGAHDGEWRIPRAGLGEVIEDSAHTTEQAKSVPWVVADNEYLYLYRYWRIKEQLAAFAVSPPKAFKASATPDMPSVPSAASLNDEQRTAFHAARTASLTVLHGGPGCGKTYTAAAMAKHMQSLGAHVALSAPTGRAKERLAESIPGVVSDTLHGLLGKQGDDRPRFNAEHPLLYDAVFVDESSMLTWAMFGELLAALKPGARLILLGDAAQLPAIGVGGVLAYAIKALPKNAHALSQTVRFDKASDIATMAACLQQGAWPDAFYNLARLDLDSVHLNAPLAAAKPRLFDWVRAHWGQSSMVLSPLRHDRAGLTALNDWVQAFCYEAGLLDKPAGWCEGLPVIVRQNHARLGVFNGDVGHITKDGCVHIARENRTLPLADMADIIDVAFAISVHQAQGSEYDHVFVWLQYAPDSEGFIGRNMVYTALTRAKKDAVVCALAAPAATHNPPQD